MAGGDDAANAMFRMGARMPESCGVLVNTFFSLEPRAIRALRDGLCVAHGPTPPVYCVGPLVSPGGGGKEKEHDHECLRWLDGQPDRSVVFLCFGSMGAFSETQLHEIAVGLEKSGQKFLWVVRSPHAAEDLDALLPVGFRDRTRDRGLVVSTWAPQSDVLRHRATGAFVTHCGWNSVLECVVAGLPMLCWPMYAEQRLNKVWVVDEMKLGVEGDEEEDGIEVSAAEVEAKVRWVMESEDDGARGLHERVAAARDGAAGALGEGGSSRADLLEFIREFGEFQSKGTGS
ncbi:hypothetical protein PR202_ga12005 [Eleusine coracana subsp. coracana]|uniref:UDP-glycosyltransferases domain-containing protein n=1 Tax=Eleusine coracana subsp. coracana TaxID=191504 RepID=A0AAV5CB18_ELECO|nr:hypothetical protein PR202_ga12005 [Eleusine coracana subsp. coracana]